MFYNSLRRLWGWGRISVSVFFAATIALIARAQSPPDAAHQGAPIVRSINVQYTGPATISRARVLAQIRTKIGLPYSDTVAEDDIRTLYNTGQFQNVRIFGQPEGDGVKVIVAVQTRAMLNEIQIDGATRISPKKLRKNLGVKLNTPLREEDLEKGRQKIVETYQAHGFNDVEVTVHIEPIDATRGTSRAVYPVNEGIKGSITSVRFEGNAHFSDRVLRKQMKTRQKTIFAFVDKSGRLDETQLQDDLQKIREFYQNHGYVDVAVRDVRKERTSGGALQIVIVVDEGPLYHVGKISFVGYKATNEQKLRALLKMKEGDVYSAKAIKDDAKAMADAYGSAGFSTVDSLIGFIELTQVNFDITNWPSLTGGGQKFRIRLQGGLQRKDAEVVLTEPWFMDRPIAVSFSGFYHEANYLSSLYDQRNYGFSLDVRKGILPYLYATLGYRLENIDAFNIAASASPQLVAETGSSTKSVVTASLVFDRRDNPFLTRRGERITYTWWVAGPGGTEQIYGFDVEASKYWHLPWDTILLVNAEVAGVDSWGDQTKLVKIYDRLFLGGSNNLRGFEFRDVGPKDEDGEPLGGQSMARVTVEYTFPIIEKARGAIFYDTGFVNTNPWDYNFNNVASDIGFGLRLDLPIVPLRLDYGIPIQQAGNHGSGKFNFNVGYQF